MTERLKVGDYVHSYITGHYGCVVGFRPNGDVIVSFPAYLEDCDPASIEPDPRTPNPTRPE